MTGLGSLNDHLSWDELLVAVAAELEQLEFLLAVKLHADGAARDNMGTALKPLHEAGLGVLHTEAVALDGLLGETLVHDELHLLDAALKVGVEVPRQGRAGDLVLFIGLLLAVDDVDRVPEDTQGREEPVDKVDPVRNILLPLGAGEGTKGLAELGQPQQALQPDGLALLLLKSGIGSSKVVCLLHRKRVLLQHVMLHLRLHLGRDVLRHLLRHLLGLLGAARALLLRLGLAGHLRGHLDLHTLRSGVLGWGSTWLLAGLLRCLRLARLALLPGDAGLLLLLLLGLAGLTRLAGAALLCCLLSLLGLLSLLRLLDLLSLLLGLLLCLLLRLLVSLLLLVMCLLLCLLGLCLLDLLGLLLGGGNRLRLLNLLGLLSLLSLSLLCLLCLLVSLHGGKVCLLDLQLVRVVCLVVELVLRDSILLSDHSLLG